MRQKFTKSFLNSLDVTSENEINVYDTEQKGLILRVRKSGTKSFVVRYKLNGKDVRTTLGHYPEMTIEQARNKTRVMLNKFADGINPNIEKKANEAKNVTLDECFNDYLRVNHRLAISTVKNYRLSVEQYLKDWMRKPLLSISRDMVERRHLKIGKKSPTRANYTMRLLRALFNFAHGEYENEKGEPLFIHNPVARISHKKLWFKETRRSSFISAKDMPAWYQGVITLPNWLDHTQANTDAMRDYLLFLWLTGLRRNECAMIQKTWIDIDDHSLTIPGDFTKNGFEHQIPLSDYLMEIVTKRKSYDGAYLFSGKTPDKHIVEPKRVIERIRAHTGVYFTPHDLRRTFITNAEYLGFTGYTLKRLLNHRVRTDVTDEYIGTDIERLRPVMQSITDRLLSLAMPDQKSKVVKLRA